MRITIESTDLIAVVNGQKCRVWDGRTAGGIAVKALVLAVAVASEDQAGFESEGPGLFEVRPAVFGFDVDPFGPGPSPE